MIMTNGGRERGKKKKRRNEFKDDACREIIMLKIYVKYIFHVFLPTELIFSDDS